MPKLHALAEKESPALIVADTLQRLVKAKDLNDYAEVTTKIEPILQLARQTGAAVLVVHHANKGLETNMDSILGSTALAGSVDNILLLNRTPKYRLLSSVQRIGPDLPETVIQLDSTTGRVYLGEERHRADEADVEREILAVLRAATAPMLESDIEAAVESRTALKRTALRRLIPEQVSRLGRGGKGDPYRYTLNRSCSLVPQIGGNKHFSLSSVPVSPVDTAALSCSHVSTGAEVDRERF